ncbi:hypothetical protein HanIR_Chr15g0776101 [Helianthus annuus]|nr:hypothetical protein HanIR_Chr15g0776101 [Helianthus annuus]
MHLFNSIRNETQSCRPIAIQKIIVPIIISPEKKTTTTRAKKAQIASLTVLKSPKPNFSKKSLLFD